MENRFIDNPDKIISLLKRVKASNTLISVISGNLIVGASVRYVGEYSFELYLLKEMKLHETSVNAEFTFENKVYNFQTEVLNSKGNVLVLILPATINIWIKRKYPRKNVYHQVFAKLSFVKPITYIPSQVDTLKNVPEALKKLKEELDKDLPDINKVINLSIREIEKISPEYEFIFYKRGITLPSSAIIAGTFMKPVLVEDTKDLESYIKSYEGFNIVTYGDYMKKVGWDDQKVINQVKNLRLTFSSNNIRSLIAIPIKFVNDIIGFLICFSREKNFSVRDVMYLDSISLIISEAYVKNKVFSLVSVNEYNIPLIDVSAGGIRFEVDNIMVKFINIGDILRIYIKFPIRIIQTLCKVVRIDTTKNSKKLWVACSFSFISNDDVKYFMDFVG